VRVVIDTNVVVSAALTPGGKPDQIVQLALAGGVVVLHDARILAEYREVLARPHLGLDRMTTETLIASLERVGELVAGPPPYELPVPDPDDLPFIEVALAGSADAIATGNRSHFPKDMGIEVLTPAELLARLRGTQR
jgi:putative PIN family toxin of toxin-antitoxin system